MASSRRRLRRPLRIRNALSGALGSCPRFRCLGLCPRVHLRCPRLRRWRRRHPWSRRLRSPFCFCNRAGFFADVAGYGARADIVGLACGQKCSQWHSVFCEIRFVCQVDEVGAGCIAECRDLHFMVWLLLWWRCPRKLLGFQDGVLPLLLADFGWLSGLSLLSMRSGKVRHSSLAFPVQRKVKIQRPRTWTLLPLFLFR